MNSSNRLAASSANQSDSVSGMMPSGSAGNFLYFGIEALVAAVGVDQPRLVKAVPAHHAADGVGDQPFDVFFTVGAVEGDLVVGHFGESSS